MKDLHAVMRCTLDGIRLQKAISVMHVRTPCRFEEILLHEVAILNVKKGAMINIDGMLQRHLAFRAVRGLTAHPL